MAWNPVARRESNGCSIATVTVYIASTIVCTSSLFPGVMFCQTISPEIQGSNVWLCGLVESYCVYFLIVKMVKKKGQFVLMLVLFFFLFCFFSIKIINPPVCTRHHSRDQPTCSSWTAEWKSKTCSPRTDFVFMHLGLVTLPQILVNIKEIILHTHKLLFSSTGERNIKHA